LRISEPEHRNILSKAAYQIKSHFSLLPVVFLVGGGVREFINVDLLNSLDLGVGIRFNFGRGC
jgi:hypothetical protein